MDEELDHILLDQLHSALRRKKLYKRMIKMLPHEKQLVEGDKQLDKFIEFCQNSISDKALLTKKHKRKKQKDPDILARNPVYEWYRQMFYITIFGYKAFVDYMSNYNYFYRKGDNDESS